MRCLGRNRRFGSVAAVASIVVTGFGCTDSSPSTSDVGRVEGWICMGSYGTPSADGRASAQARGASTTHSADPDGRFVLDDVPAGQVTLILTNRAQQVVEQIQVKRGETTTWGAPCTVSPASLSVRLCQPGSTDPRPGVPLTLTYYEYGGPSIAPVTLTTAVTGVATFAALVPGLYHLDVPGLEGAVPLTLMPSDAMSYEAPGCFDPSTVGAITGRTCNPLDGTIVCGITVELKLADGSSTTTQSDTDGRYSFDGVVPGDHVIIIRPPLQSALEVPTEVRAGETTVISSACDTHDSGSIAGVICDAGTGLAQGGATLRLELPAASPRYTITSPSGYFELTDLPAGDADLVVLSDSGPPTTTPLTIVADTRLWITPESCDALQFGAIIGRVCNPVDQSPVAGISIELSLDSESSTRRATSADDGAYAFELVPPGHHSLVIRPVVQAPVTVWVDVTAGLTTDLSPPYCTGTPAGTASLQGIACVGVSEHHPLAGATVTLTLADGQLTSSSGLDGAFSFSSLPAGTGDLTIQRGSWSVTFPVTLTDNQLTDVSPTAAPDTLPCVGRGTKVALVTGDSDNLLNLFTDLGLTVHRNAQGDVVDANGVVDVVDGLRPSSTWVDNFAALPENLAPYDMILLSSGLSLDRLLYTADWCSTFPPNDDPDCVTDPGAVALANLEAYMNDGGAVYVSDWAYEIVRLQLFQYVNFYDNDFIKLRALCGEAPQTPMAQVMDENLALALGSDSAAIAYETDFSYWAVIDTLSAQRNPYLRPLLIADVRAYGYVHVTDQECSPTMVSIVNDAPLLSVMPVGASGGRLVFSTFRYLSTGATKNAEIIRQILMQL